MLIFPMKNFYMETYFNITKLIFVYLKKLFGFLCGMCDVKNELHSPVLIEYVFNLFIYLFLFF